MSIRKPIVAGTFYESDFQRLENQIKGCFTHKKGPGELPVSRGDKKIKAVVCPHAAYHFSGPCAAWSYQYIAESKFPDCYILLGPSHMGAPSSLSSDDWRTPFGLVKTDQELAKLLSQKTELQDNPQAHLKEHSLEVQLPFLQFVSKDSLNKLRILPIALNGDIDLKKLALDMQEILMDLDKEVVFIVSSDFTHYGASFGYLPFSSDIPKRLYDLDLGAINLLLKRDPNFLDYVHRTGATICGKYPLALLTKLLNTEGKLLQYYTSADIQGDYRNTVGYASILFD